MPDDIVLPAPTLLEGDVHVWRASLNVTVAQLEQLYETLTADERSRAERFYLARDRDHFVAGRGILRNILGLYLGIAPKQVRFGYGANGKPELANFLLAHSLDFNLSHSHGLALYAFARDRKVGIDVEYIRPNVEVEAIAKSFFAPGEYQVLRELTGQKRLEAFYNAWTRKEALLKARGDGMSHSLAQIQVSLAPGEPATVSSIDGDAQQAAQWSLEIPALAADYVAAVAAEGTGWSVLYREWNFENVETTFGKKFVPEEGYVIRDLA